MAHGGPAVSPERVKWAEEAKKTAKEIAIALFGVGTAIVVYCAVGYLRGI